MLNEGKTIAEVARSFGITETTWHRWKNTYGGMKANDAMNRPGGRPLEPGAVQREHLRRDH